MNLSVYILGRYINRKIASKNGRWEKIKSEKESQNNEIEVTTEIKEGKNSFMLQHHIPCRDLNFQVTTKF